MIRSELRNNYLFESFDEGQLRELERISRHVPHKPGDILFYEGEKATVLHVIESGRVRVYKCDPKGNEIVMGRFGAGDMIAEMPCFEHGIFPASARCESDAVVLKIDYGAFEAHFLHDTAVSMNILRSMAKKIKRLEQTISTNLAMDATEKVARFIHANPEQFVAMKKKALAQHLNMTPETLSRVLKKFKDAGLVVNEQGKFTVLDREGFKTYLNS